MKAITNHAASQAFGSWLPSSRFDMRTLLATQHGWISSSSVCADQQSIAFVADAHYRPPLDPFSDDGKLNSVFTLRDNRMLPKLLFQVACRNSFSRRLGNKDFQLVLNRNIHQPTPAPAPVHFRFLFGTSLHHAIQASVLS